MALCDSYSGSHWLSLPFSGILWPSLAHYCSLILRIQALIGSQGPCSTLNAAATLTHFLPLCRAVRLCREKKAPNSFFLSDQPFIGQISSKYLWPSFSSNGYLARFFLCHVQLVLNIFVTSCLFSDWIATGPVVNLLAYGPGINSHPNM